jgi:hypothetical protein
MHLPKPLTIYCITRRTWADMFKYRVLRKIFGAKREEVTISKLEEKYKKKKKIVNSSVQDMRLLQVQQQTDSAKVLPLNVTKQLSNGHTRSAVINICLGNYSQIVFFLARNCRKAGDCSGKLRVYCACADRN